MKAQIDGYQSFPGDHCGSVAMRGLLNHYCGLELPEAAVFGLGAGVASVFMSGPGLDPGAILFGRTASMEQDLARHLGVDYRERPEPDDAEAWRVVREEVIAGRPTMLSGDIFYLDYREFKVHFPSHRFVLLGFDDDTEKVSIADRIRPEPEICSYGALSKSRNPPEGMSTQNLWGRFHDTNVGSELRDATRRAIASCSQAMLAEPGSDTDASAGMLAADSPMKVQTGVRGVHAFARDLATWPDEPDASWRASFNASCIEKFGNGGGNFRRLYSGFLTWARALDPRLVPEAAPTLALEAADAWTDVSNALFAASQETSNPKHWDDAVAHATRVAGIEARLFEILRDDVLS
ncbi:MAG: DUF4872 domain-containing protein [Deltaproteobacteria bacterium]|nr:DUF4872 domain-containing protein [Deltaproteobacteria bacterium]